MYDNLRLFEVLTRHQIYVEGVKATHAIELNSVLRQLSEELQRSFAKLRFETLDALTKAALRSFLGEIREMQNRIYSEYSAKVLKELRDFMEADLLVSKSIFATINRPEGKDEAPADEEESEDALDQAAEDEEGQNLYPLAWFKAGGNSDRLWSAIVNAPIPANGILPLPFIAGFLTSSVLAIENIIKKGYANRSKVNDVLDEILGTSAMNYRNGAFSRIYNQGNAVTATTIQHITSIAQAGVASIFFSKYRWVSVIDSVTTEICRRRNNLIFIYGKGPLAPAHIHCRSKCVPVVMGSPTNLPASYYTFIKTQPAAVQDDIIGAKKAADLRAGKIKSEDMPQFNEVKPISLKQFVEKLKLILTR